MKVKSEIQSSVVSNIATYGHSQPWAIKLKWVAQVRNAGVRRCSPAPAASVPPEIQLWSYLSGHRKPRRYIGCTLTNGRLEVRSGTLPTKKIPKISLSFEAVNRGDIVLIPTGRKIPLSPNGMSLLQVLLQIPWTKEPQRLQSAQGMKR